MGRYSDQGSHTDFPEGRCGRLLNRVPHNHRNRGNVDQRVMVMESDILRNVSLSFVFLLLSNFANANANAFTGPVISEPAGECTAGR
jgi:hypothetical protein